VVRVIEVVHEVRLVRLLQVGTHSHHAELRQVGLQLAGGLGRQLLLHFRLSSTPHFRLTLQLVEHVAHLRQVLLQDVLISRCYL
jgi:hypothetical protein